MLLVIRTRVRKAATEDVRHRAASIHWTGGTRRGTELQMPSTDEELKKALKAFKKRVKLTQLEDDSRLGHSPLTGAKSKVLSIQPPRGFGNEVWAELADKGFLKNDGGGFFALVEGK